MSVYTETAVADKRPPRGIRVLKALGLGKEPDWSGMTPEKLAAFRDAENRKRAARLMRVITGRPDRGAVIGWQDVALPDRGVRVRVYRPGPGRLPAGADGSALPLVVHVHGGAVVGTAVQSDWVNSTLAAQLPAVVVSVEHRLIDHTTPMRAAADDGWDVLGYVLRHAGQWGVDPDRAAVFGESGGGLITALTAIRARESGLPLRAQVLVNPCVDLTAAMLEHESAARYPDSPMLTVTTLEAVRGFAVPPGEDALAVSPLHTEDLGRLAPALVVVPTLDPLADHGRRYAERLRSAGTSARLTEFPGATHAFLSMPGVVPQAKPARAEIVRFLRDHLAG